MNNDKRNLVELLRDMANHEGDYTIGHYWNVCDDAADRIEELEWLLANQSPKVNT